MKVRVLQKGKGGKGKGGSWYRLSDGSRQRVRSNLQFVVVLLGCIFLCHWQWRSVRSWDQMAQHTGFHRTDFVAKHSTSIC